MHLELHGIKNEYDVQMLAQLLFPGSTFHHDNAAPGEPEACVIVQHENGNISVSLTLRADGKEAHAELTRTDTCSGVLRAEKRAVGEAFLLAGEKLFGERPAFGILTGVRPAKLATKALEAGLNEQQTVQQLMQDYLLSAEKASLTAEVAVRERQMMTELSTNGCSLYISIPFCPTRCAYCSFISFATKGLLALIPSYLEKLCRDIRATADLISSLGMQLDTVYIGGGTPTTLDATQLRTLLETVDDSFHHPHLLEFTLEAGRPDTITEEKMKAASACGVTRVSINPQTLNDDILRAIGRRHTKDEFFCAFETARKAGSFSINTDLIAGLPGDDYQSFCSSFDGTAALAPENITVHTFSVKKAADLHKAPYHAFSRSGGDAADMVRYARAEACRGGWNPYYLYRQKNTVGNLENVGYAKAGMEGRYNVIMMEEQQTVFACGAGAVTRLMNHDGSRILRIFSAKYPYEYLSADGKSTVSEESMRTIHAFFADPGGNV